MNYYEVSPDNMDARAFVVAASEGEALYSVLDKDPRWLGASAVLHAEDVPLDPAIVFVTADGKITPTSYLRTWRERTGAVKEIAEAAKRRTDREFFNDLVEANIASLARHRVDLVDDPVFGRIGAIK